MADEISSDDNLVLPIVEERATISKEIVETGRVRITTHVERRQQLISEALQHRDVVVERVAIGEVVETAPEIRLDGDILIYPIVEEILVVEKRLVLKEELRISRKTRVEVVDREVTLRSVHADIERTLAEPS